MTEPRLMTTDEAMAQLTPLIEQLGELCVERLIEGSHAGTVAAACFDAGAKAMATAADTDFYNGGRERAFEGLLDAARLTFQAAMKAVDDERRREQDRDDSADAGRPADGDAGAGQADSRRRGSARDAEGSSAGDAEADSGTVAETAAALADRNTAAALRRGFHIVNR